MKPVCVDDYRRLARRRLPSLLADYIEGGSLDESALGRNVSDFGAIRLRQRVLHGVDSANLATNILGTDLSLPLVLAPVGMSGMFRRRGEVQGAKAAAAAGTTMCLSTLSICDAREVVGAAGPVWYQLYLLRDRDYMKALLERVWNLGCRVLAFTVDVMVPGERLREHRQGLAGGMTFGEETRRVVDGLTHPAWLWDVYLQGRPHAFGNVHQAYGGGNFGAFWTWVREAMVIDLKPEDIAWIRANWPGQLVIKGVLDPDDARIAVEAGVDGIIVSNHGGRQLNASLSTIAALPRVVEAVDGRATVLLDGGIRTGEDIVKAMALGAAGCLIGRPWAWALAARGEEGVTHLLQLFKKQMATTMVLAGCDDVAKIGSGMLA